VTLLQLLEADIHRDGGSYGALFSTDEGPEYGLWLQRSGMPDEKGLHHRWLFEYRGVDRPANAIPVVTGSDEEQEINARIQEFLARPSPELAPAPWLDIDTRIQRLAELLSHTIRREPCFPSDLRAGDFVA
jgi:hypothetical protein